MVSAAGGVGLREEGVGSTARTERGKERDREGERAFERGQW